MQFSAPLADASHYPTPIIKALPTECRLAGDGKARIVVANVDDRYLTDHARSALYLLALSLESDVIWAPAYHCPALIEPFLAAQKAVRFFPITEMLLPDFAYLQQHLKPNESVIAVRYFGFDCGMQELADFCHNNNSLLIEDSAHAAFFDRLIGDAGVTSLIKFYPVSTGAELLLGKKWENSEKVIQTYKNLPSLTLEKLKRLLNKILNKINRKGTQASFRYFKLQNVSRNIQPEDLAVINCSDQENIVSKRRANYKLLLNGLKNATLGTVLFDKLEDNTVPYVFPFLLHDAASFDTIRQQGIQIYRWEEIAQSACELSQQYRHRLVQLPVHQDLTAQQLSFIIHILTTEKDL